MAQPPYAPIVERLEKGGSSYLRIQLNLSNYRTLLEDSLYLRAYLNSLSIAFVATLITLAVGLPLAYGMACAPERWRTPLVMAVILPFWTSFLIRVYAWIGFLRTKACSTPCY